MSHINPYGLTSKDYAKLYNSWKNMLSRCYDPKNDRYYTYGARGITVCDEWRDDFHVYARFALTHDWRVDLSIERKDFNQPYCPENCTFITMREQMRNKTNNVWITIGNETKCLIEWCEIFGVDFKVAWSRYKALGITDVDTLFYPGDLRELRPHVIQITLDGTPVAEWKSAHTAMQNTGVHSASIKRVCDGKGKSAGGYRWAYAEEREV